MNGAADLERDFGGVGQAELQRVAHIEPLPIEPPDPIDLPGTEPIGRGFAHQLPVPISVPPTNFGVLAGLAELLPAVVPQCREQPQTESAPIDSVRIRIDLSTSADSRSTTSSGAGSPPQMSSAASKFEASGEHRQLGPQPLFAGVHRS